MLNDRMVAASMVGAFKQMHQSQTSNCSSISSPISSSSKLSSSCGFCLPQVCNMHVDVYGSYVQTQFKHNDQTSKSNIELLIYIIVWRWTLSSSSACRFWLLQNCNLHISVHARLFAMHTFSQLAGTDTLASQPLQDSEWWACHHHLSIHTW